MNFRKKISRQILGSMPIKSDAFVAGYTLLQRVIKLACQHSATCYP